MRRKINNPTSATNSTAMMPMNHQDVKKSMASDPFVFN